MKATYKRLLSFLVVMAMVLSMVPAITLPAKAAVTNPGADKKAQVDAWVTANAALFTNANGGNVVTETCPGCGATNVTWTACSWSGGYGILAGGTCHRYLAADFTKNDASSYVADMGSGGTACLYLNNKTLESNGYIYGAGQLNIMGDGKVIRTASSSTAPMINVRSRSTDASINIYGGTWINNHSVPFISEWEYSQTFNLYGGTITSPAGFFMNTAAKYTPTINIYGGTITGGTGGMKGGMGGTVYMEKGLFNMYGGTIQNGSAERGGNIYISGGEFNMYGGELVGGSSTKSGGNLYGRDAAVINIEGDAVIKEGKGAGIGDNVYTHKWSTAPTLNIKGGTICDGETDNVAIIAMEATVSGGQIIAKENGEAGNALLVSRSKDGGDSASVTITGDVVITTRAAKPSNAMRVQGYVDNGTTRDYLHIDKNFTGTVYLWLSDSLEAGDTIASECVTFDSGFTGKLYTKGCEVVAEGDALKLKAPAVATEKDTYAQYTDTTERVEAWVANNSGETFTSKYCPWCNELVEWTGVSGNLAVAQLIPYNDDDTKHMHVYLAADAMVESNNGNTFTPKNGRTCFYLNNKTLTHNGVMTPRGITNIIAGANGKIVRPATSTATIAFFKNANTTIEMNVYGGTYENLNTAPLFHMDYSKILNLFGGSYKAVQNVIYIPSNGGSGATVNMYDADITTTGGRAVYMEKATVNMEGGSITGGNSAESGANVYLGTSNPVFKMSGDAAIYGGKAVNTEESANGGNVAVYSGTFTMEDDAKIYGGACTSVGGNLYARAATVTMTDNAQIYDGDSTYSDTPNVYLNGATMVMSGNAKVIAKENGPAGNAIYVSRTGPAGTPSLLVLSGNATVTTRAAKPEKALRVYGTDLPNTVDKLFVTNDWTGKAYVYVNAEYAQAATIADHTIQCGTYVNKEQTATGTFAGELYITDKDSENVFAYGENGAVKLGSSLKVETTAGAQGYKTDAEALAAYNAAGAGAILNLGDDTDIALAGQTLNVDLRGFNANFTGNGKVLVLDSENDDFSSFGTFTADAGVAYENEVYHPINGNRYIVAGYVNAETQEAAMAPHRIVMHLNKVTLRPSTADDQMGLYYKAQISCDKELAAQIDTYGVVLSLEDMPGADFLTETHNGYTAIEATLAVSAENGYTVETNSGAVFGIMKSGLTPEENAQRGEMDIFANAYIAIDVDGDGVEELFMADTETGNEDDVAWSLLDVMEAIEAKWEDYAAVENAQANVAAFYKHWAPLGMRAWEAKLPKIAAAAAL